MELSGNFFFDTHGITNTQNLKLELNEELLVKRIDYNFYVCSLS